jgi:hypothetical protein
MPATYTLEIVCPHCGRITQIADWPRTETAPVAFTCIVKHGGCGGHAYGKPPDVDGFPNLEVAIMTPTPMTAAAHWQAIHGGIPPQPIRW